VIHRISADLAELFEVIGAKAHGSAVLPRLGLPVPPALVVDTSVCRAFLRDGRPPPGFDDALRAAVADLEAATKRQFGGGARPLALAVRSGAAASMPGMMDTVLDLGLTTDDAFEQLVAAVRAVFACWDSPRARTYRRLHDIPHDLGTAVTVQALVFGDRANIAAAESRSVVTRTPAHPSRTARCCSGIGATTSSRVVPRRVRWPSWPSESRSSGRTWRRRWPGWRSTTATCASSSSSTSPGRGGSCR